MVRAPPPKASNLVSRRLASSKPATTMASVAATAASAAAASVPFLISLGCLPAKGDSRNFMIDWLVSLIYLMAMTSLATAAALQQLEEASTRLTTAATCAAKRGPAVRVHSAHSPTLKGRLGPKSTVFSASRLDSALRKMAFTSSERRSHSYEEPLPLLSGDKWYRATKNTDGARISTFVLELLPSQLYEFDHNKMKF
jgi:hypothetical protein